MKADIFLNNIVKEDLSISFFSTHENYRPIRTDVSIVSHPHDDFDKINLELMDKFDFSCPIFTFNTELSSRPKMTDICIGFLYSNNINVKSLVKEYN